MEFKEYLKIIRKRLWILIISTVLAGLISGVVSIYFLPKIYEASTTLIVGNNKNDISLNDLQYDDLLVNQKLVKTYSIIARSDRVLEQVILDLKLALTAEELRTKVSVGSEGETEILRISVQDERPKQAMKIANSIAGIFKEQVKGVLQMENVEIIDTAKLPTEPVSPRENLNILIAVFAGLVFGLGIIFMVEYLDNTIKKSEDIEKNSGLIVLGVIPDFNK